MTHIEKIRDILIDLSATSKGEDIALEGLKALDELEKSTMTLKKTLTTITG